MSGRRTSPTVDHDFMATILGDGTAPVSRTTVDTPPAPPAPVKQPSRIKYTVYVAPELLAEVQSASQYLRGHPTFLTVTDIFDQALQHEMEQLRAAHNHGEPFPPASRPPQRGRPLR